MNYNSYRQADLAPRAVNLDGVGYCMVWLVVGWYVYEYRGAELFAWWCMITLIAFLKTRDRQNDWLGAVATLVALYVIAKIIA